MCNRKPHIKGLNFTHHLVLSRRRESDVSTHLIQRTPKNRQQVQYAPEVDARNPPRSKTGDKLSTPVLITRPIQCAQGNRPQVQQLSKVGARNPVHFKIKKLPDRNPKFASAVRPFAPNLHRVARKRCTKRNPPTTRRFSIRTTNWSISLLVVCGSIPAHALVGYLPVLYKLRFRAAYLFYFLFGQIGGNHADRVPRLLRLPRPH